MHSGWAAERGVPPVNAIAKAAHDLVALVALRPGAPAPTAGRCVITPTMVAGGIAATDAAALRGRARRSHHAGVTHAELTALTPKRCRAATRGDLGSPRAGGDPGRLALLAALHRALPEAVEITRRRAPTGCSSAAPTRSSSVRRVAGVAHRRRVGRPEQSERGRRLRRHRREYLREAHAVERRRGADGAGRATRCDDRVWDARLLTWTSSLRSGTSSASRAQDRRRAGWRRLRPRCAACSQRRAAGRLAVAADDRTCTRRSRTRSCRARTLGRR